jgi:FdhD protein
MVRRVGGGTGATVPDVVPTEEPLEIQLNGVLVGTTMRTPGNDFELAAGWCLAEGLLAGDLVRQVAYCPGKVAGVNTYNVLDVRTESRAKPAPARLTPATASCGVCGSTTLDDLCARLAPLGAPVEGVRLSTVTLAADRLGDAQPLFSSTGSVHGAAAFSLADGSLALVREDVGRHNAVDKLVGRLLLSGRVSVELVQKAWAAGFGVVAAVGGPTSLAMDTAAAAGITLAGFVRGDRATVYTGALAA